MFGRPGRPTLVLAAIALIGAPVLMADQAEASVPFVGEIKMFAGNYAPAGYAFCNGQLLSISSNVILYSLIGPTFGGDGRNTFAVPDLRGRVPIHPGTGIGLSTILWGQRGGVENQTLTTANMPSHVHQATLHATSTDGNETGPTNHFFANDPREEQYSNAPAPNVTMNMACITMSAQGGGQSVNIRNPYVGIYHIIATTGTFPSRP